MISKKGILCRALGLALLMVVALPVVAGRSQAAVGINEQINFQGKLVNTDGTNIPNGTYNMEFKIYTGGNGVLGGGDETLAWTESRLRNASQGVLITDGVFQVNLGAVTTLPGSVDFNSDTLWLSMNLGTTNASCTPFSSCGPDGEMSPFVRFTAAPYALNADNLDGLDSTAFGQLSANQTWAGTQTFQNAIDVTLAGASEDIDVSHDLAGTVDVLNITGTPHASANTAYGLYVDQANSANGNGFDASLVIDNSDTNLAIPDGILFMSAGGGFTDFIDTPSSVFKVDGTGVLTAANFTCSSASCISTGEITNDTIDEDDLDVTGADTAGDEECLTFESAGGTGDFEWQTCGAGGAASLDQITAAAGSASINNAANNIVWNWQLSGAETGMLFTENTASAGGGTQNQFILGASTLAGSTASPFSVVSNSVDAADIVFNLNSAGDFEIQDAGTAAFTVNDSGNTTVANNLTVGTGSQFQVTGTTGNVSTTGTIDLITSGLSLSGLSVPLINIGGTITKAASRSFYAVDLNSIVNIDADPGVFGGDILFRDNSNRIYDSSMTDNSGSITFMSTPTIRVQNDSDVTLSAGLAGGGVTGFHADAFLRGAFGPPDSTLSIVNMYGARLRASSVGDASNPNVTVTNRYGLKVENAAGTGVVTNQYGVHVDNMTKGATVDYGVYIAGADTAALWVDSGATLLDGTVTVGDLITTSGKGIEFTESASPPTCASGNYNIFADSGDNKLKKCVNGVTSDIGAGDKYETFSATGTYTEPSDAIMVIVELWGGGGGGGGGEGGSNVAVRSGGAGGGGGGFATGTFLAANIGPTVPVTIGAGGTAGGAGINAQGTDGGAGGTTCFSTTTACAGTMLLRAFGGGGGNGTATAGNGGGGGGGTHSVGLTNATAATGGNGGGPLGGTAAAPVNSGAGGAGGATAAATGAAGGAAQFGGAGGGSSSSTGTQVSGAGGGSMRGGSGGGAGGTCTITTCTARNGGAGGLGQTLSAGGGAAGTGSGGAGGAGAAGTGYGGPGGGGGASNAAAAGGAGGVGGTQGGGGGGGGGAHTGSTSGGAGALGGAGEVRVWSIRGSGADLAEIYCTNDADLDAGDTVALDPSLKAGVKKTEKAYDAHTIGTVATNPGLVIGTVEEQCTKPVLVALAGRVPIKVSAENGPIKAGDLLTASSAPGVAMRATKAGQIIGQAMGPFSGEGTGTTIVFVKTDFSHGSTAGLVAGLDADDANFGKQMLAYLVNEQEPPSKPAQMSEIFTDRIVAGLEITAPKVTTDSLAANTIEAAGGKDINLKLANGGGSFVVKNSAGKEILSFGNDGASVALDLNVTGGLTVGGPAIFNGNAFFKKLVTFVEKTVFKNDVTLAGHLLTDGDTPDIITEPSAGITKLPADNPRAQLASTVLTGNDTSGMLGLTTGEGTTTGKALSVKFKKPFAKPPKIQLTPASDKASQSHYFVESTKEGFSLTLTDLPIVGTNLVFNYWAVE
ncbi:MAG TPA: hypothetical protein VK674_04575 [Candidatus Limnocylindria bacterium]|nr:hypothetical protein [Candidatus Limnocylindria bacterium]